MKKHKFLIHPCLDVDGSILNFSWANSEDYGDYLLNNFRNNNPSMDVEHGIPRNEEQKCRPELEYLIKNLSPYKGELASYTTLHTTHSLAGALVLVFCENQPEQLIKDFTVFTEELGIPLDDYRPKPDEGLGYLAPGFLKSPSFDDFKKAFKDQPEVLEGYKFTTYEWASSFLECPVCLIAEFPFNLDREFNNHDKTDINLVDFKKEENRKNLMVYDKVIKALDEVEKFNFDKENAWYLRACLYRDHAKQSFEKDDDFYKQFEGIKVSKADLYEKKLLEIEDEMRSSILVVKALENCEEATAFVAKAKNNFWSLFRLWKEISKGSILSNKDQIRLQLGLIESGLA